MEYPIESLLSARQVLSPQLVDDYVYFLSNMGGAMSLYRMRSVGSLPEPLLPPDIALQNPHLMIGESFVVFPAIKKILVGIDKNGDENYQPSLIPLEGGIPEKIFGEKYAGQQLGCINYDREGCVAYFVRDDRKTADIEGIRYDLKLQKETSLGKSKYGNYVAGKNKNNTKVVLIDGYTAADNVLYLWTDESGTRQLLFGTPIEEREEGKEYPPSGIGVCNFTEDEDSLLFRTTLIDDSGSAALLDFADTSRLQPVNIQGLRHKGRGELTEITKIEGDRYLLNYNIDGCSWVYEAALILGQRGKGKGSQKPVLKVMNAIVGRSPVANGVVLGIEPWALSKAKKTKSKAGGRGYAFAFTTATEPSQIYSCEIGRSGPKYERLSSERVLGIKKEELSAGEDRSYTSFDGERISARLYLPAPSLALEPPYPLVLYVHGGPQGQERPDFTWFSMPLIQYLTLNGFAVFVPNARGSTGYGLRFMKMVDHDWGGRDRLDLVEGLKMLETSEPRVDSSNRGVIGRSYGGYMTLTLVSRHPELWKAGVDMFGPYNLLTFLERLPETWRTAFYLSIGNPEKDKDFLTERSPSTYIDKVSCAMMMIQGRNDPRVVEAETHDVVDRLKARGLPVEYLVFEDEGHDVIKFKNRVKCYEAIEEFFSKHLKKMN